MRRAILSNGPQGAGKTTFCREVVRHRPEIVIIERDEILIELFGQTCLSPYGCCHEYGEQVMWGRVQEVLADNENVDVILDTWCGYPRERARSADKLRKLGAEIVDLWYFVTPEEVCVRQYEAREVASRTQRNKTLSSWDIESIHRCGRDNFRLYHRLPVEEWPDSNFDRIRFINPCQMTFIPYADLLL